MKKFFTFFLLTAFSAGTASAQRLLTEDFNYSAGQLTDSAGGANVSGGKWTPNTGGGKFIKVVTGDLSYAGYGTNPEPGSGRILLDSTTSSAEDAFTSFDSVKENTVYCSFLLQLDYTENLFKHDTATGDYFVGLFTTTSKTNYTARLYIRKGAAADTYNLGIAAQAASSTPVGWIAQDIPAGSVHLVTIGYQFVAGTANDVAKLWLDAPVSGVEPPAQASSVYVGTEPGNLARFAVRQGFSSGRGGTPKCQIDAIKVSTSWVDGTLPLQLRLFSITNRNGFAGLSWQTCNEINVKKFEIEKSADAVNFAAIATVAAKNAACATAYNYSDAKVLSGTAYYRIRMVDNDGASDYSAIVSVNGKVQVNAIVSPNPVTNNLVLSHPKTGGSAALQVIGFNGNVLLSRNIQQDAVQTAIDISSLAKGNHIVVFINGNEKQTVKFIKQ
ncbi:MAG TPA: T9SS type A sorting domain-containing protein [Panacibacter sp.]|nr:T9SS type A sorting domain-containing protein [Panacibacter sp.]